MERPRRPRRNREDRNATVRRQGTSTPEQSAVRSRRPEQETEDDPLPPSAGGPGRSRAGGSRRRRAPDHRRDGPGAGVAAGADQERDEDESATTLASSPSKCLSTVPVKVSATKRSNSQLNRDGRCARALFAKYPARRPPRWPRRRRCAGRPGLLLDQDVDDVVHGHDAEQLLFSSTTGSRARRTWRPAAPLPPGGVGAHGQEPLLIMSAIRRSGGAGKSRRRATCPTSGRCRRWRRGSAPSRPRGRSLEVIEGLGHGPLGTDGRELLGHETAAVRGG